ncbi:DNA repair protein XRCC2-like protein isoform X1 [Senna tora]|uniref:DNA repair protein XRCC2-like protein isoform X1 n=1 Tax=Senna tora TaxID=362788 RepID=A0A834SWW3_9FABA|nr:DNA repair protein XRCC2-like protein isoform X1 [Senna tora]
MQMDDSKEVQRWIGVDENANQMLARVFMARPFLLPPPLHRVPLRFGNVVEILGPLPSAKTHILIQVPISMWNEVEYGGLDHLVVFVDLDCRFDIMRLSEMLNHRIAEAGNRDHDETLYNLCMSRFLYVHCYNSFEFLQTLKTLHYRLQKEKEAHGVNSFLLMIDSIGAFHWVDRSSTFLPLRESCRKTLFPQRVSEAVVQEIKKLIQVHSMLIVATKATIFVDRYSTASSEAKCLPSERFSKNVTGNDQHIQYREYMPSAWQSFVTHRILSILLRAIMKTDRSICWNGCCRD